LTAQGHLAGQHYPYGNQYPILHVSFYFGNQSNLLLNIRMLPAPGSAFNKIYAAFIGLEIKEKRSPA